MPGRQQPTWCVASGFPLRFALRHDPSRPPQDGGARSDVAGATRRSAYRRPAGAARGCLSLVAPLVAQLFPIVEALPDLPLEAALGRIVEFLTAKLLGEIVLAGECLGRVMVVFVSRPIAFGLHQLSRCVEDVLGREQ